MKLVGWLVGWLVGLLVNVAWTVLYHYRIII